MNHNCTFNAFGMRHLIAQMLHVLYVHFTYNRIRTLRKSDCRWCGPSHSHPRLGCYVHESAHSHASVTPRLIITALSSVCLLYLWQPLRTSWEDFSQDVSRSGQPWWTPVGSQGKRGKWREKERWGCPEGKKKAHCQISQHPNVLLANPAPPSTWFCGFNCCISLLNLTCDFPGAKHSTQVPLSLSWNAPGDSSHIRCVTRTRPCRSGSDVLTCNYTNFCTLNDYYYYVTS